MIARRHAAPEEGDHEDVTQREAGGPAPKYESSPKWVKEGEATVNEISSRPGMTNYSTTATHVRYTVHTNASADNPKMSRQSEVSASQPEAYFSSNISLTSATPSFMRSRIGGDEGVSVVSGSITDTSSAAVASPEDSATKP